MEKRRIVVVGGGFAGLMLIKRLPKKKFDITLIDPSPYFSFTPMIVETVSGGIRQENIIHPYRQIFHRDIKFILSSASKVNLKKKTVTATSEVPYDTLIISLGSEPNFYGIKGVAEHTLPFRTVKQATAVRAAVINAFEAKEHDPNLPDPVIAIIGAGPTGCELAAELHDLVQKELPKRYGCASKGKIILIDAGEAPLPGLSPWFRAYAKKRLIKRGIDVRSSKKVLEARKGSLMLENEQLPCTIAVWTAGMKARRIEFSQEVALDRMDRIHVDEHLRLPGYGEVYAIGDCAHIEDSKKNPLPQSAQVAEAEAEYVARSIIKGTAPPFRFKRKGYLVSLGRFDAVGEVLGIRLYGVIAWFAWRTVYLSKLMTLRKKMRVAMDWTYNLFSGPDITDL